VLDHGPRFSDDGTMVTGRTMGGNPRAWAFVCAGIVAGCPAVGCELVAGIEELSLAPDASDASADPSTDVSAEPGPDTDIQAETGAEAGDGHDEEAASEAGDDVAAMDASDALDQGPAACTAKSADCDGDEDNGCETDITTSGVNCGSCGRDCLGGACAAGLCQPVVLATSQEMPAGLAVDVTGAGGRVYWTNRVDLGKVSSVAKSGGLITVHAPGQPRPGGIVVDGTYMYWNNSGLTANAGSIWKAEKETASDAAGPMELAAGQDEPFAIALTGTKLSWTNVVVNTGSVATVDINGTGLATIASNQNRPGGIACDTLAGYWTVVGEGEIWKWSGDPPVSSIFLAGLVSPTSIAIDMSYVYWADVGGSVSRATRLSSPPTALPLVNNQGLILGLAVDGLHMYWADNSNGRVMRSLKAGGSAEVVADQQQGPFAIALDNDSVFWTNTDDGTIMRRVK
jgi:hypothetical protein